MKNAEAAVPPRHMGSNLQAILQLHDLLVGVLLDDLLVFEPVDVAALVVEILAVSALSPPKYLKIGDVMEIEIEGIGRLKNGVHAK